MKKVNIIGYIVSGILIAAYIIILSTALNPKVKLEYDLYYIEKDLQDWPGYDGLNYSLGTKESFAINEENRINRRGRSWNAFEEDGCWTYGEHASLFYTGLSGKDLVIEMEIEDIRENASAAIYINNSCIGEITAAGTYYFKVSKDINNSEITMVELLVNNYGAIGEDTRNQGIKVKEIMISDEVIS